jgi:hypothetical protein
MALLVAPATIRPAAICKNPAFSPALSRPLPPAVVDGETAPHLKHLLNFTV